MLYSVDRIEEDVVVCIDDNGEIFNISLDLMPDGVKVGCILKETNGQLAIDIIEENSRREANFKLSESLFEN